MSPPNSIGYVVRWMQCRARSTIWSAASRRLGTGEHRDIIETYRMFAADRGWLNRIVEAVQSGLTAEAAVQKIREENRTRMLQIGDPYLRERLLDLEDLANRLQTYLAGGAAGADLGELPPEFVLVAKSMGPAELLDYAHRRVRGLVLEEGSPTAHVAIVARAFDIPVVGRVEDATARTEPGDIIIVDGDHGQVLIRPSEDLHQSIVDAIAERTRRRAYYGTLRDQPAVTRDGVAGATAPQCGPVDRSGAGARRLALRGLGCSALRSRC